MVTAGSTRLGHSTRPARDVRRWQSRTIGTASRIRRARSTCASASRRRSVSRDSRSRPAAFRAILTGARARCPNPVLLPVELDVLVVVAAPGGGGAVVDPLLEVVAAVAPSPVGDSPHDAIVDVDLRRTSTGV